MAGEEWKVPLRELLENKIMQVGAKHDADFALLTARLNAAAQALELQAEANKVHFESLNHEGQRINDANARNLDREVYIADQRGLAEKISRLETAIAASLPAKDFQTYKDSVADVLSSKAGVGRGVAMTGTTILQVITGLVGVVAIISALTIFFGGTRALPVSNPVTVVPASSTLVAPPVQR